MNSSTNSTNPRHIWMDSVITTAQVTVEQANPFREMLNRWYTAGEPVWMAADSLKMCVKERANEIRREQMSAPHDLDFIRKAFRQGR